MTSLKLAVAVLAVATLGFTGMSVAQSTKKVKNLKSHLNSVESKKSAVAKKIRETKRQSKYVLNDIQKVDSSINSVSDLIDSTKDRLDRLNDQAKQLDVELKIANDNLKAQTETVRQRMRRLYMSNEGTALSAMLASDSLGEMAARRTIFDRIADEDRETFTEYKIKSDEVAKKKTLKLEVIKETQQLIAQQSERKKELAAHRNTKKGYLSELREEQSDLQAQYSALDRESEAIEGQIRRYMSANTSSLPAFSGRFAMPVRGARISSGYGYRHHPILGRRKLHTGIDFAASSGTPIYAAAGGVVISSGYRNGYGNTVIIDHGGGIATLYGHCSRLFVSSGQKVSKGTRIAAVGSTGMSTGPHLHFEVRVNGSPVDPRSRI